MNSLPAKLFFRSLLFVCIFLPLISFSQQEIIQQKNFPLLSLIQENENVTELINRNESFKNLRQEKIDQLNHLFNENSLKSFCPIKDIVNHVLFTEKEMEQITDQFKELSANSIVKELIAEMRKSDQFQMDESNSDAAFIQSALKRELEGINKIISVYALAAKPNYPRIDSVSYSIKSDYYQKVINITALNISDDLESMKLFFDPSLTFALWLMKINNRDEAARFEPMELGENAKAVAQVARTDWSKYTYSVILVPGYGPEKRGVALSPLGMLRCKLAADRYQKGLAPFIILSGGYVHPFQTPFCEAIEMKKELMNHYGISESALIIEPHARHTTTNFRNAARLIFKYHIPAAKKALCTTTIDQSIYITDMNFDQRCLEELGYIPYKLGERLNRNDVEFYPLKSSLFLDNNDPLDP